jgi:hypothetical protein
VKLKSSPKSKFNNAINFKNEIIMDKEAVIAFCRAIGMHNPQASSSRDGEWVRGFCPMCWKHGAGKDRHPSFGIKINPNGRSFYHCFAHGGGSLERLLHSLMWYYREIPQEAFDILDNYEVYDDENLLPNRTSAYADPFSGRVQRVEYIDPVPEYVLEQYPPASDFPRAMDFLVVERGIEPHIIAEHDVRFYDGINSVLIPVRNALGELIAITVRHIQHKSMYSLTPELTGYPDLEFPSVGGSGVFFGEDLLKGISDPVMLVESPIEAMTVRSFGFDRVVAACGSVSNRQIDNLIYPIIFLGLDADEAGIRSSRRIIKALLGKSVLYYVNWSKVDCSDPGELGTSDQLSEVLYKRVMIPLNLKEMHHGI